LNNESIERAMMVKWGVWPILVLEYYFFWWQNWNGEALWLKAQLVGS
jgi:hypothetical protein